MTSIAKTCCAALAITLAMAAPAFAQDKACADGARDSSARNLSEKLDEANGVICPPNVDPNIKAPTPNAGKMPIIPPPGSPGGDPTVQPK